LAVPGPQEQEHLIAVWRRLATHYRDEPAVLGYDLLNEPIPHFPKLTPLNSSLEPLYQKLSARYEKLMLTIFVSSGAVQYLVWNVYATFASKGLPKRKVAATGATRKRICEHQLFVSRPTTSVERFKRKNSKVSAWENAESAHSAGHNEHGRLIAIVRRQPRQTAIRCSCSADSGTAKDIPALSSMFVPSVRPVRHADQGPRIDLRRGSRRSTGSAA